MTQLLKAPLWPQVHKCPSSSTRGNDTGATHTQAQSTAAHATSFAAETTNAPMSTATSPPSVPSASSSSISQADTTSTLPQSSSVTSALTANTPAAYNGRNANNNSGSNTTSRSGSSPPPPSCLTAALPISLTQTTGTQGIQEVASITRGGGAGTITDNTSFSTVTNLFTSVDPTPTPVGNVAANDSGDKSPHPSKTPKPLSQNHENDDADCAEKLRSSQSTIIANSVIGGVIVLIAPILIPFEIICNRNRCRRDADWDSAGYYDQNNQGVNSDVTGLDNGGRVEASVSFANSRSSHICTGRLRQPHMVYVDSISNTYGFTPGGYFPVVAATQGNMASDPYSMRANPLTPVHSPASLPDTYNYNHGIGPSSGYGVDMAAIGGMAPAAGVAGIRVARMRSAHARITANAGGNMNMNTNNPNIPNNAPPPPPILTVRTTSNTVASPLDSLEPASAVSVSQAYGGVSMLMTASSIYCDGHPGF
ncbi:hypothetical protein K435DRAFT_843316 [Dendrothele bispora CBS 962.96]|uniref:Uncharacterized protein n=1 Tax=Dendrothele bispora (strain CBS 962.96) TaxID=1314807 RepID=A0A4S8L9Y4_DENBC|nr:hypothetical protein K435DRAFT_843316 [Dendrothele bispora CBS 962.96]